MTAPGRRRKLCRCGIAALAIALSVAGVAPATRGSTTEQIVVDRYSGLAIMGYDPVAYFVDRKALPGRDDQEWTLAGAVWRFRNEGNRAAFIANPAVYAPRFGGYDPLGIERGVAIPGDPRLWHITGERLYLFYSPEDRAAFVADAVRVMAAAERKWPSVQQQLVQ